MLWIWRLSSFYNTTKRVKIELKKQGFLCIKGLKIMRFLSVYIVFAALGLAFLLPACGANRQEEPHDEVRPYLNDSKIPHNVQWENDTWKPEDWIEGKGSAKNVIDGFYAADIITDQHEDGDTPVLEVGQGFMKLSEQDKRRVVMFVDQVFKVTDAAPDGMFYVRHKKSDKVLGIYNKDGLHLQ